MKKVLFFSLTVLVLLFLAACGSDESTSTNDDSSKSIALFMADLGNPYFHVLSDAVEERGKELGYEVLIYDGQNDPSRQPSQIEDAIQKGVDAIIINPGDESSTSNALKEAKSNDIPVVTVDRAVDVDGILSYIVTDNTSGGEMTGEWLQESMPEGGNVVHIEGVIGTAPQRERGSGFLSVIDPAENPDSNFEIIDTVVGEFSMAPAENAMSDLLAKHDDIDVVFAQNDIMAVGAVRAIETAGRVDDDIVVIGFDGSQDAFDLIDEGLMHATAVQDFEFQGNMAVDIVDGYLNDGTEPESEILVDVYMYDQDSN